jgi:hypothetical protein
MKVYKIYYKYDIGFDDVVFLTEERALDRIKKYDWVSEGYKDYIEVMRKEICYIIELDVI